MAHSAHEKDLQHGMHVAVNQVRIPESLCAWLEPKDAALLPKHIEYCNQGLVIILGKLPIHDNAAPAILCRHGLHAGQELGRLDVDATIGAAEVHQPLCTGLVGGLHRPQVLWAVHVLHR